MKSFFKKLWCFTWKAILAFLIVSILSVILFRFVPVPITPLMVFRNVEALFEGKHLKLKKDWVSIDNISNHLQLAVICSEDQNFTSHHGFDFKAINKAIKHNQKHKHKRGASTISQQTAKNLFLWSGRSWIRKGFEVYFTGLIEFFWNKKRIMEVYLNIIEMGDGIYGAEAASKCYFKKDAINLTRGEAALIAAILPNPRKFSAVRPSGYIQRRQSWVIRQMGYYGNVMYYDRPMNNDKGQNDEDEPNGEQ
jgi:monofunctional glycosyltransferase